MKRFSKHYPQIASFLEVARVAREASSLTPLLRQLHPQIILVDDKLAKHFRRAEALLVLEKNIRYKHHRRLMLVADNLANYFRILLRENPRKLREELRRFEK